MRLKSLRFFLISSILLSICIIIGPQFVNLSYSETSKILNLSNGIINSTFPQIKTFNNNTIFIFWTGDTDHGVNNEIQSDIFLAKSENKGNSFEDPVNISNNTGSSFNPQSEISSNNIYVVWEDDTFARSYGLMNTNTSILFKQSKDNGNTFSVSISLSSTNTDSSNPDIIAAINGNNTVHVVWQDNSDKSSKILFKKNISNKNTIFSDQQIISNDKGNNYEILPQIVASSDIINIIWNDFNLKDEISNMLIRNSIDGGNNFGKTIQLNNNNYSKFATNDIIKMYNNNVYIVWQGNIKGQFDIFLAKSSDGGITFSKPINLSNDSGDSINPDLIVLHNNLHIIWNDNSTKKYNVMFKSSSDGGITFSKPINLSNTTNSNSINPQMAATANELFVAWQEDISGNNQIYFRSVDTS